MQSKQGECYLRCRLTADATTAILKHPIAGDLHIQVSTAADKQSGGGASAAPQDKDALPDELGVGMMSSGTISVRHACGRQCTRKVPGPVSYRASCHLHIPSVLTQACFASC